MSVKSRGKDLSARSWRTARPRMASCHWPLRFWGGQGWNVVSLVDLGSVVVRKASHCPCWSVSVCVGLRQSVSVCVCVCVSCGVCHILSFLPLRFQPQSNWKFAPCYRGDCEDDMVHCDVLSAINLQWLRNEIRDSASPAIVVVACEDATLVLTVAADLHQAPLTKFRTLLCSSCSCEPLFFTYHVRLQGPSTSATRHC